MTDINIPGYEDHLVAFIDILGFKDAIQNNKHAVILELLQEFARYKDGITIPIRQFKTISPDEEGEIIDVLHFEVNAFSDCLVITIPINNSLSDFDNKIIYMSLINYLIYLTAIALKKGFLIRGGIANGKQFNQNGILFGDALIEAYRLESKVAIGPRIIIPNNFNAHPFIDYITDQEGVRFLNIYDTRLIMNLVPPQSDRNNKMIQQMNELNNIIEDNISRLKDRPKDCHKWKCFKHYYCFYTEQEF